MERTFFFLELAFLADLLGRLRRERILSLTSASSTLLPSRRSLTSRETTSGTGCLSLRSSRARVCLLPPPSSVISPPFHLARLTDRTVLHDPSSKYSKKELERMGYCAPIVDHAKARVRAIARYKK